MNDLLRFEPLIPEFYDSYIEVGIRAYTQHYLHLWPNRDPTPYIESSFTKKVLESEQNDRNTILYRILKHNEAVGIFKMTLNAPLATYTGKQALCLDKIYILHEHSGMGIGKKVVQFGMLRAKELHKKIVWLDTMQHGRALEFYLKNGFEIHSESKVMLANIREENSLMWVMVKKC